MNPLVSGSSPHHDQEENGKNSRKPSGYKSRDTKNPYANRGIDKFSELLTDLEDKKKKIYTKMGSEDISVIHFKYTESNKVKPVVVKFRDPNKQEEVKDKHVTLSNSEDSDKKNPIESPKIDTKMALDQKIEKKIKKSNSYDWRENLYYLVAVLMFVLLFLAMFGRSLAIVCTSLGWFLVPAIKGANSDMKRPKKIKKEYRRNVSDDKIVHLHRKSW